MASDNLFPLPFLEINQDYQILFFSEEARELFFPAKDVRRLIEETDRGKFEQNVRPDRQRARFETNMITRTNPLSMFELSIRWQENRAEILCYPIEERIGEFLERLQNLRKRLSETDFTLLKKKEELEAALIQIDQLSGPFIPLSERHALVPLFGHLSAVKIRAIENGILSAVFHSSCETIVFDLTAVGKVTDEGIFAVQQLFQSLELMGIEVIIVGMKPNIALEMNRNQWFSNASFVPSISEALRRFQIS